MILFIVSYGHIKKEFLRRLQTCLRLLEPSICTPCATQDSRGDHFKPPVRRLLSCTGSSCLCPSLNDDKMQLYRIVVRPPGCDLTFCHTTQHNQLRFCCQAHTKTPLQIQKVDPPFGSIVYTIVVVEFRIGGHSHLCRVAHSSTMSGTTRNSHMRAILGLLGRPCIGLEGTKHGIMKLLTHVWQNHVYAHTIPLCGHSYTHVLNHSVSSSATSTSVAVGPHHCSQNDRSQEGPH